MIKVAIMGAAGRMGRTLVQAVVADPETEIVVALEHSNNTFLGKDAGEVAGVEHLNVPITSDLTVNINRCDVVVDFTSPEATLAHLALCRQAGKAMVIGTTGFSAEQRALITQAAQDIAIVFAPNMSVGINLSFKLLEIAAQVLGETADVEIIEAHHRHKVDAPSGTALKMGEIIAHTLNRDLTDCALYGRQGRIGERNCQTIGFETIRAGDIVGEHTVMFADIGERLEITHRASSRMTFAKGAVRAVKWLEQREKGLFDMQDVLGLNKINRQ